MKAQVPPLPVTESADVDDASRLETHSFQRGQVGHGRDHQSAGIFEADEAAMKQVIEARGQQQAVLTIEAFFVG